MHSTLSPYFSTLFSHFFFTIFNHKMGNWKPWSSIRQYLLSSEKTWKYLHCNLFPIRHLSVHFCLEYIICEVSPSGVDLCWLILIDADWFWLMLIDSGWCWCWCWCWCWHQKLHSTHVGPNHRPSNGNFSMALIPDTRYISAERERACRERVVWNAESR